jgi:tetratricopeptide (TPR) repeat protein
MEKKHPREAMMMDPNPNQRIQDLLLRREFASAEALLKGWMKNSAQSAEPHYWAGVTAHLQGRLGPAIQELKKALELNPKHTDAAVCLSVLYNDLGRYDEAKQVFEQANQSIVHKRSGDDLEIDRKFAVKHLELADLYVRYRRYDEAIEEYGKAIALDPTDLEIRIRRSKAYAKKGFVTRALQDLQSLRNEHPKFVAARLQLGLLHFSQGNVLDAELEWEAVLQIAPGHREAKSYLEMAKRSRMTGPKN